MSTSTRFWATAAGLLGLAVILIVVLGTRSSPPLAPLPHAGTAVAPDPGNPLAYRPSLEGVFVARAAAGEAHALYVKTPGGAVTTAARVTRLEPLIDRAAAGTSVSPRTLQAIVFLESAGDPEAIAGGDPTGAAGLTQIVAATGTSLLRMKINLAKSRTLTGQIDAALSNGSQAKARRLERQRAAIDDRFDPQKALDATVRYLEIADRTFGRMDLAVESYHMGIGNLKRVLTAYDGGAPVPYAQLYFDSAPDRHGAAYALLSSFGDDSWTYLWRIVAAEQIMERYRSDRAGLVRTATLQVDAGSAADVLHPPAQTTTFADPAALDRAYAAHQVVPLPSDPGTLGLAYAPALGQVTRHSSSPAGLYRGLRPGALALLAWLGTRVKALSGTAPLTVASAVSDNQLQQRYGYSDPPAAAGWSFTIERHYANGRQAAAFQSLLDRLQSLNLIAWQRYPSEIEVTVASDASSVLAHGV